MSAQMMPFLYNDGGRAAAGFKGLAGDCVVRAVAIATGKPYQEVYDTLSEGSRKQRKTRRSRVKPSARSGVSVKRKWFRDYMIALGWTWTPTMHIGSGCKVHLLAAELPSGRLIVSVAKHYTAVIDGVIQDTFDPNDRPATLYPNNTLENIPTSAKRLANGNGWIVEPGPRCVYGYWRYASVTHRTDTRDDAR